ncbi:protein-export membrane protein SecF [Candidatus Blochmanniella vafra str. BVAF]|uniref:Protein-export membrane protein SecF n=1 Tax=Blochmanniella vafra (strain BVAF) TaxID=859654 RepID=E8Q616_BLOVB|nr:protein translocase subunit SecF [Candidatus Blochmannia vafer]ADV33632.1 protein-export membrane protein SecF [Candidatus Blochmannia vafer str. BVAF]
MPKIKDFTPHNKVYDFIFYGRDVFFVFIFLCAISFIVMKLYNFNWGLDFTGGLLIEVVSDKDLDIDKIRNSFIKFGFKTPVIQYLNNTNGGVIIRVPLMKGVSCFSQQIEKEILNILDHGINHQFVMQQINWIGPNSSKNLIKTTIIAFFMTFLCIFLYITYRFELTLSIATFISLIYDIIITLGFLSVFYIEINSTTITALISSMGYSLNDKIVIFDRIRENFSCMSKLSCYAVFNRSLTQVLNRTIITSVTTIMVLLILLIFGGAMLYEFSITLLFGVIIGTISSIYVASFLAFRLKDINISS